MDCSGACARIRACQSDRGSAVPSPADHGAAGTPRATRARRLAGSWLRPVRGGRLSWLLQLVCFQQFHTMTPGETYATATCTCTPPPNKTPFTARRQYFRCLNGRRAAPVLRAPTMESGESSLYISR